MLPAKGNGDLHEEDCIVVTGRAADVCGQKLNVGLSHVDDYSPRSPRWSELRCTQKAETAGCASACLQSQHSRGYSRKIVNLRLVCFTDNQVGAEGGEG